MLQKSKIMRQLKKNELPVLFVRKLLKILNRKVEVYLNSSPRGFHEKNSSLQSYDIHTVK